MRYFCKIEFPAYINCTPINPPIIVASSMNSGLLIVNGSGFRMSVWMFLGDEIEKDSRILLV